jgi:hypothetical protein
MPTSPPRPVSRLGRRASIMAAALAATALLAAASPVPVVGADTAAACTANGGSCGG